MFANLLYSAPFKSLKSHLNSINAPFKSEEKLQLNKMNLYFIGLFFLITTSVQAEYRVFILEIANSKTNQRRQIQSTLDPVQYASIYPLNPNESIMYQDTWLCRGNTAQYKQHCDRPPVPSGR